MNATTANLVRLEKAESFLAYRWPLGLRPNLETQIKLLRREIPPETMAVYHQLKRESNQATAEVLGGVCQGCDTPVPKTLLNKMKRGQSVCCGHCGRFLYQQAPPGPGRAYRYRRL